MTIVLLLVLASAEPGWKPQSRSEDLAVLVREVPGSKNDEIRVETRSKLPPQALCKAAFGTGAIDRDEPVKAVERRVLRQSAGERVTYERISPPMGRDRDFTVRYRLVDTGRDGGCSVLFEPAGELGPGQREGVVRMTRFRGRWDFRPEPSGGTAVTYEVWSEPGGGEPRLFVEPARRKVAVAWTRWVLGLAAGTGAKAR